jgi:hypothetical protein
MMRATDPMDMTDQIRCHPKDWWSIFFQIG